MRLHRLGLAYAMGACAAGAGMTAALTLAAPPSPVGASHGPFPVSTGIYRIPYPNGTSVTVSNDHHDHNPVNRIDMSAGSGTPIVAAASGIIRAVVDYHGNSPGAGDGLAADGVTPQDDAREHSCQDDDLVVGSCSDYNNYVWIEHPNGEWTKYTHFGTGTVTANGWAVGAPINAGDVLGLEGDVGRASGPHLHHEVGLPNDPNDLTPFSTLGGFMVPNFGVNLVPLVCDIATNLYASGESYTANPCNHQPPTAAAGGPYVVNEGSTVVLDGAGSSDPEGRPLTYLWAPSTNLNNPALAQPTFGGVDDAVIVLTLTVYDQVEALSDSDTATVTVLNVPPTVTAVGGSINEGGTATVRATFTDPGVLDTHTAAIDWKDGTPVQAVTAAQLAAGVTHVYGDNGVFAVLVTVTDDDGGSGGDIATVIVGNVNPTAEIDETGTVLINGVPTFLAHAGVPLDFKGRSTDPGSDDLALSWDWDDGPPAPDVTTISLVNPPNPDPFPSPSIQPRDVTDQQPHAFDKACFYLIKFRAVDDDGGNATDEANVIIVGNALLVRSAGYWQVVYDGKGPKDFDTATLACYLKIVAYMSKVFNEVRDASTIQKAAALLKINGNNAAMKDRLDRQLLAAWLNFANGTIGLDELVDTDGDKVVDTKFSDALAAAEAVRLNPASTNAQLEAQLKIVERTNLMDGG